MNRSGGGCNIADKIQCKNRICYDINEDLICLLKYIQKNPTIPIAPEKCSFEHYAEVRADANHEVYSQEYRALIGYTASYGGRYFDGGYGRSQGRSKYNECLRNLLKQAPALKGIEFGRKDYAEIDTNIYKNCLFYLDPPYRGTKKYSKQNIDYDYFYKFCRKLSEKNIVVISEFEMPADFKCIWQKEKKLLQDAKRTSGKVATEKLFIPRKEVFSESDNSSNISDTFVAQSDNK